MRYYIATKLENSKSHNELRDYLASLGHQCTYDWTFHGPVWTLGYQACQEVADRELEGVECASVVIVLTPAGRGTHVEFGAALGLKKIIIFFSENEAHHDATPELCAFYTQRSIIKVKSKRELWETCRRVMGDARL